ncbi:glutaminyl-peptide cyclotransferase [Ohtaekwangia koreensis]|uniref:Glutamine cyclotransferase n=1 Tax=Ohtaekwangia koreensis TaxID=688867 RepID=A0A1T5MJR9_9BACT|nr:glutaminyl-peptide cyclotransferase [Ohtaekwangia koreensis]SKC88470.1 Glutamine cyclotransferase [Ohtaekwangia koreensis]
MKNYFLRLSIVIGYCVVISSCGNKKGTEDQPVRDSLSLHYTVISTLPHNSEAYTQGLTIYQNKILESTGQNNHSWIAEVNPGSGQHDKKVTLPGQYFGEGITVLNDKIYHLTWQNKVGFVYDARTYKQLREFKYDTEGWGITHDTKNLIMSDGSEKLYFLDTTSLKPVKTVTVMDGGTRVKKLNELEYINGYIYANVYETNWILKIDPATGKVAGRLDFSPIGNEIRSMYPNTDVLNGIAYDPKSKAILLTGKLWPKSYLVRLQ